MQNQNENPDDEMMVTLSLDDGTEVECIVITIFEAEGKDYIALLPADDDDAADEGEVYIYRYHEAEDGTPDLIYIDDDEEYEVAADAFDEWLDSQEYDEDMDYDPDDDADDDSDD